MGLEIVTAPSVEPVTVPEVIAFARHIPTVENAVVGTMAKAARIRLEKESWRAFVTQTWDLKLDRFPSWEIQIPRPPLQSITSITYIDQDDASQTVSSSKYEDDTPYEDYGRVFPIPGETWPTDVRDRINAVTIRFVAGYGLAADVPDTIKVAIMQLTAYAIEHRMPIVVGTIAAKLPLHFQSIVDTFRARQFV